ncbi:hypothetical protein Tco_0497060 [Tanacetum coccineum]
MFTPVNVVGSSCDNLGGPIPVNDATLPNDNLPTDPLMPDLEDTGIFSGAYDDEDVGVEADLNNLETTMNVSPIPTTRIHKDHPKNQIIGDINSATQTRRMTKISEEHAMFDAQEVPNEFYGGAHFLLRVAVKTTSTPIEINKAFLKDEEAEDVDVHLYRSMIGSLMYLTASRPDIREQTPLFPSIWQFKQKRVKVQDIPLNPNYHLLRSKHIIKEHSLNVVSSSHQKTQTPRQALNQVTELPQTSEPIPNVPDEAVYEEWDDRVERATTTAASLDAAQASGNITKTLHIVKKINLKRFSFDELKAFSKRDAEVELDHEGSKKQKTNEASGSVQEQPEEEET